MSTSLPPFFRVRQHFERPQVENIPATVDEQLQLLQLSKKVRPGETVAITAGSRGIANIHTITRAAVITLRQQGAKPFIIPAIGSHGGGTAEGQREVLASYGITEEYCGCEIRASMDTVVLCRAKEGFDVHFDRIASEADHVLVCNRIKPHSRYAGDVESGLMKMLLIGLGKHHGAKIYHQAMADHSFGTIIRSISEEVLAKCNILGGLAIIENAFDETALLAGVPPNNFEQREKELLLMARKLLPRLPFQDVDVLIIDQIGKNISGTGIDTNVVGRKDEDDGVDHPRVRRMIVRSISEASHGNACGIGLVDFATRRAIDAVDWKATWINCLTGNHVEVAKQPIYLDTDRETLEAALTQIGFTPPADAKIVWIKNTKKLTVVECSAAFLDQAQARNDLEILSDLRPLPFDSPGNLPLDGVLGNWTSETSA